MKKRLLSLLLSLVMVLSLLPVSAFAKDYVVGDTVVVESRSDLPAAPDGTEWEFVDDGSCNNTDHWQRLSFHITCERGAYKRYKLVESKGSETPSEPTGEPGLVTATKKATANTDGTYTITLTIQGNQDVARVQTGYDAVLVIDNSGSMGSGSGSSYNNCMDAAKKAAKTFSAQLLDGQDDKTDAQKNRLAVFGFEGNNGGTDDGYYTMGYKYGDVIRNEQGLTTDKTKIDAQIDAMYADGGTNYTAALNEAYNILNARSDTDKQNRPGVVVFITDGEPGTSNGNGANSTNWNGTTQADQLKKAGYSIFTIGIGLDSNGQDALNKLASTATTETQYAYNVSNDSTKVESELTGVLTDIAYRTEKVAAGTNAVMTDVINTDKFKFVSADSGLTQSAGTVTWEIGTIPTTTQEISFVVKPKVDLRTEEEKDVLTNDDVTLSYTDPAGQTATKTKDQIGEPKVDLPANAAVVTVKYVDENGAAISGVSDVTATVKYDTVINENSELNGAAVKKNITNYAFDYASEAFEVSADGNNTLTLYYGKDEVNKRDPYTPGSDGIPDKYQAVVTYQVVNGTWVGETTHKTEIKQVYTLKTKDDSGAWVAVTPAPKLSNIPTAQPDPAYKAPGEWDVTPDENTVAEHGKVYTYTYSNENTYTVTYHANTTDTVTDLPKNATVSYNGSHTVGSAPSRDGYTFNGWATSATGSVMYAAGATISNIKADIDLYAVWQVITDLSYTVNYLEKGTTNSIKDAKTVTGQTYGAKITAASEKITIDGYVYDHASADEITIGTGTNVIDLYYEKVYTLTYDANGGSGAPVDSNKYKSTDVATVSGTATRTVTDHTVVFLYWSETNTEGYIYGAGEATKLPAEAKTVSFTDKKNHTVYAVWGYDDIGENPEDPTNPNKPDKTPDVYQAVVTFKVVNGTWNGTDAKTTIKKVYDLNAKLGTLPTATANAAYSGSDGAWDATAPTTDTDAVHGAVYTYRFSNLKTYSITVNVTNGTADVTSPVTVNYGANKTITFTANDGYALDTVTVDGVTAVLDADGKYTFSNVTKDHTITVVYAEDKINEEDPYNEGSDGIPDKYQAVVTFTVKNGTWKSEPHNPIKYVYNLKELKDGVWVTKDAYLNVPTATPNTGYANGSWGDNEPKAGSAVTKSADYTLTYTASELKVDPEDPYGDGDTTKALVWKELSVRGSGLGKQTFTVTLTEKGNPTQDTIGNVVGGSVTIAKGYTGTVEMNAAGKKAFSFDEENLLTFTKAGSYTFTVTETKGSTSGMTYDTNSYELTIVVAEGENGLYVSEVSAPVTVKNSYQGKTSGGITIQLEKGEHFNYVMGYSDGTIRPNNQITRAEIAMIFFRLLTKESRDYYYSEHNDFTDVADTAKSNIAISTLTKAGIITGYSDGTFRPNAKVTRGQLAAIIARFADMKGSVNKSFSDIDGYWAKDLILLAASNGWIDGYSDGTFRPANNITRAQTMAIINRALDRQVSDVKDLLSEDVMNVWTDNMDPDAWYYFHVQEATNYHAYTRKKVNSLDEKWTAKIKDIDWSVYQF